MMMPNRPVVIAFDVIETLFALEPLADRLRAVGLPSEPDVRGGTLLEVVEKLLSLPVDVKEV
jgi:hypothetical protein